MENKRKALMLIKEGRLAEALQVLTGILQQAPQDAQIWFICGSLHGQLKHFPEAKQCLSKAIELQPDHAEAHVNLGNAFKALDNQDAALEQYREALRIRPDLHIAWFNSAILLEQKKQLDKAEKHYRQAIIYRPDYLKTYSRLGDLLQTQMKLDKALDVYFQALRVQPNYVEGYAKVAVILCIGGRVGEGIDYFRKARALDPDSQPVHTNYLLALNYMPGSDFDGIYAEHLRWGEHCRSQREKVVFHNAATEERRVKVGYVSGDFWEHAVAHYIEALLRHHDRSQVEVTCYSNCEKTDDMTKRLRNLADRWVSIVGLSDEQAAERIRSDGVDILVDLSGHTEGNRLGIFARHAAPVQVTYLGYPNTTGLKEMDYRLTDSWADPKTLNPDQYYTEELVRLEGGFLSYSPPEASVEVGALPALRQGYITYGSFNNLAKVNEQVIRVWSEILKAVPNSRLILKYTSMADAGVKEHYWRLFEAWGVERKRVELMPALASRKAHLDLYNRVDIGLDPFPYNGTTTTCEALWMGVPVVVLAGNRHAGRVGVSLLSQAGLDEWIAEDEKTYIDLAVARAKEVEKLAKSRSGLRTQLQSSPLCDGKRLARQVEQAYREM
ncbi:MAG: tetratricopeptide repeat protein, partial [Gammaproteobacteria bacterium]